MKTCSKCGLLKPIERFYVRANGYRYPYCKSCDNTRKEQWNKDNKEKRFNHKRHDWLKSEYGINLEEWEAILASQNNACAICQSPTPKRNSNWIVDHCHRTGRVRGLLCHSCNVALGHIKDSVTTLRAMQAYLER